MGEERQAPAVRAFLGHKERGREVQDLAWPDCPRPDGWAHRQLLTGGCSVLFCESGKCEPAWVYVGEPHKAAQEKGMEAPLRCVLPGNLLTLLPAAGNTEGALPGSPKDQHHHCNVSTVDTASHSYYYYENG